MFQICLQKLLYISQTNMIIAVIDEAKPTGSLKNISNITENSNDVIITIQELELDYMMATQAFHVVKISIITKPFVFQ